MQFFITLEFYGHTDAWRDGELAVESTFTMHTSVMSVSSCLPINKLILLSCISTKLWTAAVNFSDPGDFEQKSNKQCMS